MPRLLGEFSLTRPRWPLMCSGLSSPLLVDTSQLPQTHVHAHVQVAGGRLSVSPLLGGNIFCSVSPTPVL